MICRNCRAAVDNDLVFCTSCGARLYETMSDVPTVALNDSVVTQMSAPPVKKSSPFKWIALIVALVALPSSLGIAYLLTKNQTAAVATTSENKNAPSNRKNNANAVNKNNNRPAPKVSVANTDEEENSNGENTNSANGTNNAEPTVIFDEQIEIAAGAHIAYQFKADDNVKVFGKIDTVRGEPVKGYFYIQNVYDEHFPDANFKVSGFDVQKAEVRQYLVGGDYVLVFLNEGKSSAVVKGKLEMQPNE